MALCLRTTSSAPCAVSGLKPRVTDPSSGSESAIGRRVARVVTRVQIDVFAKEFMVEISCLRKSATSSFCKVLLHRRDVRGFGNRLESSLLPRVHHFKKWKKVLFFFDFNSFGPWLGFGFCGLILSFAALQECNSFFLFFKQQVSREFIELVLVTPTLACSKTCDFT